LIEDRGARANYQSRGGEATGCGCMRHAERTRARRHCVRRPTWPP
jgi:hypothetical protein